jgi:hydrogenase-4 component E
MTSFPFLDGFFAGGLLLFSFLSLGALRLPTLVRYFALASLCLAGLIASLAITRGEAPEYGAVLATVAIKVILVYVLLIRVAKKTGASLRLETYLRAGSSYLLGVVALLLAFRFTIALPLETVPANHQPLTQALFLELLFVAVALMFLGLLIMIIRRNLYAQMVGLLTIENGIATFSAVAVGGTPFLIEMGIFFVIATSVFLMLILSRKVYELYGATDTAALKELVD